MFVHGRASASPGIGGTAGVLPVAITTASRAASSSSPTMHAALAGQPAAAAHERDASLLEPGQLTAVVEVRDHLVAAREHRGHAERAELEPGYAGDLTCELDRAQQGLRRHARVEGAFAADEAVLDDRHLQPSLTKTAGADLTRSAGSDHHHVELAHLSALRSGPPFPRV